MSTKDQKDKKKEEKKKDLDLGALEEDDDFEEFPAEETIAYQKINKYIKQHHIHQKMLRKPIADEHLNEAEELGKVEIELEKLNEATIEINLLEKGLEEARKIFREQITETANRLKELFNANGSYITEARPYFVAINKSKQAQIDCQHAELQYKTACENLKGAHITVIMAEQNIIRNPGVFDKSRQDMINSANVQNLEAEKAKRKEALNLQTTTSRSDEMNAHVQELKKKLGKSIAKARPYFQQRANSLSYLEKQKICVQNIAIRHQEAKSKYSESLRNLEMISEQIHIKRNELSHDTIPSPTPDTHHEWLREEGEEAESCCQSDPSPVLCYLCNGKVVSENDVKKVLTHRRNTQTQKLTSDRYLNSLLCELNVDFDVRDADFSALSKCRRSKRSYVGSVNRELYEDCHEFVTVSHYEESLLNGAHYF